VAVLARGVVGISERGAMIVRVFFLILVGILGMVSVASADTIASTATQWGLLGTWAFDCSVPPGRNNTYLTYSVRRGMLFHDRNFGDKKDSFQVLSASAADNGELTILIKFDSETRQFTNAKGDDGRMRSLSNRNVDTNEYSIRDGKFTANGNTTRWLTHCH
jgi:hypothetical protein